ncbi:hypothetical protein [Muricauda sp. MAR_2010_75]|nr:hypothetical protein [Muricauda sp. MAR_2010_75]
MRLIKDKGAVKVFKSEAKNPKVAYKKVIGKKEFRYATYEDYLQDRPIK